MAEPFSLTGASYPAKVREITARRNAGLFGAVVAWWSLGGVLALVLIGAFAVARPRAFLITSGVSLGALMLFGCGGLIVAALMLPALKADRMAAGEAMMAPMAGNMAMDFAGIEPTAEEMPTEMAPESDPAAGSEGPPASEPPRVRRWFPETLLWRPELVTDENGEAVLQIDPLADSITTWRLSGSAVSADGRLGAGQWPIRVFQPFFVEVDLPVALTRNDQVGVPIVVYNYLDRPQQVTLEVADAEWFQRLPAAAAETGEGEEAAEFDPAAPLVIELKANEIRAMHLPICVLEVGRQELAITARGGEVADAIVRTIEVVPDGRREEQVVSGSLESPAEIPLSVPAEAIPGSARTIVKLYPSTFSQLVEGLDNIFQMPSGCFEQTSSTTYPNILALDYLNRTKKSVQAVEAKARQYIHIGYQRLVSFEVPGGGFDWFGNPPANRTLTAYGLLEFQDMAKVHDVDPELIRRTRNWLLAQRKGDGSWPAEVGMLDDGLAGSVQRGEVNLSTTAYLAWAVFQNGAERSRAEATLDFLLAHPPAKIEDPYVLALTTLAIATIEPKHEALAAYAARLNELKQSDETGKQCWWKQPEGGRTSFYGSGLSGDVETTAMATLALLETRQFPPAARGALTWLVAKKDPNGTWYSTQATVLALKALVAGTSAPLGEEQPRRIEFALGGEVFRTLDIAADQAEVMQQIDLSDLLTGGEYHLTIRETTETGTTFQVTHRYHVPEAETPEPSEPEPLAIEIVYDRERLAIDETVTAVATVTNQMAETAPMVILDLPIPGGFSLEPEELDELKGSGLIAKYQLTPRKGIIYLRAIAPGESLELRYRLRATMPVKVAVPAGTVYEYYNPARRGESRPAVLEAT